MSRRKGAAGIVVDWDAMRTEYIQGGVSYRELAAKYGVPFPTLADRARAEKWVELRKQAHDKAITKTVENVAKQNAKVDDRINRLANRLIDKLEKAVDELDVKTVTMKTTMKTGAAKVTSEYKKLDKEKEGPVDKGGLQQLTNTLRDLKAILDVRSELDRQEQEARIANLRRQAETDGKNDGATLVVDGLPEEFKV
ncbi:MAG: helix-turn-helix domain-containing protein [Faecousia sp.]